MMEDSINPSPCSYWVRFCAEEDPDDFEAHVGSCEFCQRQLEEVDFDESLEQQLREENSEIPLPDSVRERVLLKLQTHESSAPRPRNRERSALLLHAGWLLVAASLLLAFGFWFQTSRRGERSRVDVAHEARQTKDDRAVPAIPTTRDIPTMTPPPALDTNALDTKETSPFEPAVVTDRGYVIAKRTEVPDEIPFFFVIQSSSAPEQSP